MFHSSPQATQSPRRSPQAFSDQPSNLQTRSPSGQSIAHRSQRNASPPRTSQLHALKPPLKRNSIARTAAPLTSKKQRAGYGSCQPSSPFFGSIVKIKENGALPSPKKKKTSKSPGRYEPPSKFAHLPPLEDVLVPNLFILFCGLNPGIQTATSGHAYAHPSNRFWKLLHASGITSRLLKPQEDRALPADWSCGNTNIVVRPTVNSAQLSTKELDEGVSVFEQKVRQCRPEVVCLVGKGIWDRVRRARRGRNWKSLGTDYGWQDERMGVVEEGAAGNAGDVTLGISGPWKGARIFVACSTSGAAASTSFEEKLEVLKPLGTWVQQRRLDQARNTGPKDIRPSSIINPIVPSATRSFEVVSGTREDVGEVKVDEGLCL
ncbi:G/U mismatch-specific DNA glycosylase [Amylocarpus encephaloides]|uniref:G/U mismatch-specific DNA glycosylase n=1 Tax=Amylocarpus encephaloides TaxID=45428 RepID=A0A9P7Y9F3_9HELO|nr:G/U mismatch-specific DNA glycosylase [Amylocarpus encephaloides]